MRQFCLEKDLTRGLKLIKVFPYRDERGEYLKSYSDRSLHEKLQ
jgi:hypothetical protein